MTTDSILNWLAAATAGSTALFLAAFAITALLRRSSGFSEDTWSVESIFAPANMIA